VEPIPPNIPRVTPDIALNVHPQRAELYEELHSRPSPLVETPCGITHIAVQIGQSERAAEYAHLVKLCSWFDASPPAEAASCFYQTFGGFELRWERHTEFSTYTFIRRVLGDPLRQPSVLTLIPEDWLTKLPGQATTALHLAFGRAEGPVDPGELERYFEKRPLRLSHQAAVASDTFAEVMGLISENCLRSESKIVRSFDNPISASLAISGLLVKLREDTPNLQGPSGGLWCWKTASTPSFG